MRIKNVFRNQTYVVYGIYLVNTQLQIIICLYSLAVNSNIVYALGGVEFKFRNGEQSASQEGTIMASRRASNFVNERIRLPSNQGKSVQDPSGTTTLLAH